MRFCFLTTFFPPKHFGGDAIFVAKLANALASRNHDVHVVHCEDSFDITAGRVRPSPFPLHPSIKVYPLRYGPLSPITTYLTGFPGPKRSRLEEILAQDFDVVHWHNLSLVGGPGALKLARGVRLCTFHDYFLLCPTHILFKFRREACTEPSCLACTLAHHRPPQLWRYSSLLEDSLKYIDRFIAPSEFVHNLYRDSPLGIDSYVLPHFVDFDTRTPSVTGTPEERQYYLFVGRLEKAKGIQNVLPVFAETGRRLVIAGAGNYEGELRQQASGFDNIEFLGRVPHQELERLYRGAQATLVPSICFETFGMIILESLRSGTPVVVSDFGALPEVVRRTGGGWIYRSLDEFRSILDSIDKDPAGAAAKGQIGQQQLEQYSEEIHLKLYFDLIDSVGRRKSGR